MCTTNSSITTYADRDDQNLVGLCTAAR